MYYVYWIRNADHTNVYEQGYVGITNNTSRRMAYHEKGVNGDNRRLYEAIQRGAEMEILHEVGEQTIALQYEKVYRPHPYIGWNINPGGLGTPDQTGKKFTSPNHGMRNKTHSNKTKKLMSESRKRWKWWNDGVNNVRAERCPAGYKPGRVVNYRYNLTDRGRRNIGRSGRTIATPHGNFCSILAAARAINMTEDQVRWRLRKDKWPDWKYIS